MAARTSCERRAQWSAVTESIPPEHKTITFIAIQVAASVSGWTSWETIILLLPHEAAKSAKTKTAVPRTLWHFVHFHQRHAARIVRATYLHRVGARAQADQNRAIAAVLGECERSDAGRGRADLTGVACAVPPGVGHKALRPGEQRDDRFCQCAV